MVDHTKKVNEKLLKIKYMLESDFATLLKELESLLAKVPIGDIRAMVESLDDEASIEKTKAYFITKFPAIAKQIWDVPKEADKTFDLNVSFQIANIQKDFAEPNNFTLFGIGDSDNSNEAIDLDNKSGDDDPSLDKIDPYFLKFDD